MSKYQDLVNLFVSQLEAGTRPWAASWRGAGIQDRPLRHNGIPYQGCNVLALWLESAARGFDSPYWLTFKQAQELGANVRKGAKSACVYYMGQGSRENDAGEVSFFRFLKTYCVFNAAEIESLPAHYYPAKVQEAPEARIAMAEGFVANTRATIQHGGNRAFYAPKPDYIQMPQFNAFESPEAYYATLLHELTHWTGSNGRVDRPKGKRFGDAEYAMEELVAELGAAFLCADLGISDKPRDDHAPYLAGWAKALSAQPSILMSAAGAAEKAAAYLHGLQAEALPVAA